MSTLHLANGLNRMLTNPAYCIPFTTAVSSSSLSRQVKETSGYFCTIFNVSADIYNGQICQCKANLIHKAPIIRKII